MANIEIKDLQPVVELEDNLKIPVGNTSNDGAYCVTVGQIKGQTETRIQTLEQEVWKKADASTVYTKGETDGRFSDMQDDINGIVNSNGYIQFEDENGTKQTVWYLTPNIPM